MDRTLYIESARNVVDRLRREVNGIVRYDVFPEVDVIVVKIFFKDFDFKYAINNIQDLVYNEGFDDAIDELLKRYKKAVLNGFFKTDERKERERLEEYGIKNGVLI